MTMRPITEDDLQAHVDGALDRARETELADYLAENPDVARRVEQYASQRDALRAALAPVAEEPIPAQLDLARLIASRRYWGLGRWRSAAASILLLCAGGLGGWSLHGMAQPQSGLASVVREASASYALYAPDRMRPVEIKAADATALQSWVSGRLDRPVAIPDLSDKGYRFMGGRLVATPHAPAVLFMYDDDKGKRLVLQSRTMEADRNAPMTDYSEGSLTSVAWADNGIGYSLIGPMSAELLRPIANEVRRQAAEHA